MDTEFSDERVLFLKNTRLVRLLLVAAFLLIGLGVRLIDLSDPPLDFAVTRQLHSLVLARGYYYEMNVPSTQALSPEVRAFGIKDANNEALDEPPILEHITADVSALVGKENFEIPRVMLSLLWVIGGIPLFLLMRKITTTNGAVFGVGTSSAPFYAQIKVNAGPTAERITFAAGSTVWYRQSSITARAEA